MARLPRLLSDREWLASGHLRSRRHGHHRLLWTLPVLVVASLVVFFVAIGGHLQTTWPSSPAFYPQAVPLFGAAPSPAARRVSPYSFDLAALAALSPADPSSAAGHTAAWMADAPDDWSLARLALPGTHDTMTHRLNDKETGGRQTPDGHHIATVFRCQNNPLAVQLAAGVRYLDIRARVQVQPSSAAAPLSTPPPLGIYHADVYTGYDFAAVAQTVFAFLDAHPSEAVVLRLKEEGAPVRASAADPPGCWHGGADRRVESAASSADSDASDASAAAPFLASFDYYRLHDPRTVPGFAKHVYQPAGDNDNDNAAAAAIPTVGALRGKVLLLQEFPYFVRGGGPADPGNSTAFRPRHGVPWRLASPQLQVEDDWRIADLARLDGKWTAVEANLRAAAAAATAAAAQEASSPALPLFLSHLSASVGVTPIDAAAGPVNGSVVGINDRTGPWLAAGADGSNKDVRPPPVGIVIADFPGRRLVEAILRRNSFVSY